MTLARMLSLALAVAAVGFIAAPASALIRPIPEPTPVPRPLPPPGWAYRWVPPVYRTVADRIWIAERRELVADWLEVRPGQWQQVWREVIIPGHWQTTTRRILVSEGYWQLVRVEPPPPPGPPPIPPPPPVIRNPGTVGVDGYGSGPVEDLSAFSPLTDWPERRP